MNYQEYLNEKNTKVSMEIKDFGKITLELFADVAPITVANFIELVKKGFYNGLTFHRIILGFMIPILKWGTWTSKCWRLTHDHTGNRCQNWDSNQALSGFKVSSTNPIASKPG